MTLTTEKGVCGFWRPTLASWCHCVFLWFPAIPSKNIALHSLCPSGSVLSCQAVSTPKSGSWCGWNKNSFFFFFFLPGLVFRWMSSSISSKIQMHKCLSQREKRDPIGTERTGLLLSLTAKSVGWAVASSPRLENGDNSNSLFTSHVRENIVNICHICLHLSVEVDHRAGVKPMQTAHSLGR